MSRLNYIIDFDLPYQFCEIDLFEIDGKKLINWPKTKLNFQNNQSLIEKTINKIEKEVKIKKNIYFWLSFSGVFLEQLNKFKPNLINKLKNLVKNEKIKLVVQNYHRSYALSFDQKAYVDQIEMSLQLYQYLFNIKPKYILETENYNSDLPEILKNLEIETLIGYFKFKNQQKNIINLQPISNSSTIKQTINPFLLFTFNSFLKIELSTQSIQTSEKYSENFKDLDLNKISLIKSNFNTLQQACLNNLFSFKKDLKNSELQDLWCKLQHYSYFQNIHQNDKIGFENYRKFCFLLNQFREKILNG